jgi:hypothetical protein
MESQLVPDVISAEMDYLPQLLKYQDLWTISLEIKGILLCRIVANFEIFAVLGSYAV